jgi:hypothetical protein
MTKKTATKNYRPRLEPLFDSFEFRVSVTRMRMALVALLDTC